VGIAAAGGFLVVSAVATSAAASTGSFAAAVATYQVFVNACSCAVPVAKAVLVVNVLMEAVVVVDAVRGANSSEDRS
jgi:hypothetical protein